VNSIRKACLTQGYSSMLRAAASAIDIVKQQHLQ
jgi:hypothetical protein